jgi:aminoglycoside phosphotransferase (APT) family kinase protein
MNDGSGPGGEGEPTAVVDSLIAAIRAEAEEPSLEWATPPTPLTGGFWAQLWRVELTSNDAGLRSPLVARVMPDPEVAERETAIQAHLADSGYPTPVVRLAAPPGPELDRAWMLMDLAPGQPLLDDLSGVGAIVGLPRTARSLPDRLARHAVALHALDPGSLPEAGTVEEMLSGLRAIVAEVDRTDLVAAADWLLANRPAGGRKVICHGDLHPFNVLTDPTGDTVLDWSKARITNPAYDVAYTRLLLANPPLEVPRPLAPVLAAAGRWLSRRFTRSYDAMAPTPIDSDQLDWFTSLQTLHILAEVAEADGEVSRNDEHPFLLLEGPLSATLSASTGIPIG